MVKNLSASTGDIEDTGLNPWVCKIAWRRAWQLQYSGLENPVDKGTTYSPWGHKELNMTEAT